MDKTFLQLNKIVLFEQIYLIFPPFHGNIHEQSMCRSLSPHVIRHIFGLIFRLRSLICQLRVKRL